MRTSNSKEGLFLLAMETLNYGKISNIRGSIMVRKLKPPLKDESCKNRLAMVKHQSKA